MKSFKYEVYKIESFKGGKKVKTQWGFRIVSKNGNIVDGGKGYDTKQGAERGLKANWKANQTTWEQIKANIDYL